MLCLTYGVRLFDDYSLPADYGYGGGTPSQLADLARSNVPAGTYGGVVVTDAPQATAPQRPKMRIVPNPGEERQYAQPQAHAPHAPTQYAGQQTPAELAANQAATMPRVTPQSSDADIISLQRAMVAKGLHVTRKAGNVPDGDWGETTSQSIRSLQGSQGLQQQDVADGAVWAVLLAPPGQETAALSAYNSRNRGANIASGLTSFAEGLLTAIKPPAPNATFQPSAVSGSTPPPSSGSGWQTYALVAGGILLLGGIVYFATRSDD